MTAAYAEQTPDVPHVRALIVGSGFAGIAMAVKLREQGVTDFLILERADDVGGTWRDNTYPGAACDVPSHLYSFSFAPNPTWSRSFSPQAEIQAYLRRVAAEHRVTEHVRFGHEMLRATWHDDEARWLVETSGGSYTADVLISGSGALSDPSIPDIPGMDRFAGTVFHSARWRHDHDLAGKRVAAIGTGASAIQFVPQIQPQVAELKVFQRTPPWIIPRVDRAFRPLEKWLFAKVPAVQRLMRAGIYWGRESYVLGFTRDRRFMRIAERMARRHLDRQVADPGLRAKLTPTYTIGCKRILISNDYYPALTRPNVELVTTGIREITETAVVTDDGREHEVDTIIFGTGFHVTDMPIASRIRGRDGVLLADAWADGASAYVGTTVAGFPNLFIIVGPNTGLGHTSMVIMIEAQVAYIADALRQMDARRLAAVVVREDVQARYNDALQSQVRGTVWNSGGCKSWYLDARGRNTSLWPDFTWRFVNRTRAFDLASYDVRPRTTVREVEPAAVAG
jgi:cation diffusion facilitator CzcD-associated flavoprotein CzcO